MRLLTPGSWPIRWWLTGLNVTVLVCTLLGLGALFLSQVDNALVEITVEHLRDQVRPLLEPQRFRDQAGPAGPAGRVPAGDRPQNAPAGPVPGGPPGAIEPRPAPPPGGFAPRPPAPGAGGNPAPFNPAIPAAFIVAALRGPDTGAAIFDMSGAPLAVSEASDLIEAWPTADPAQLQRALAGMEQHFVVGQQTRRTLVLLLPWRGPQEAQVGVVQVSRSLELTDQLGARLGKALLLGTLLAALIAALAGFRATRLALRPLDRVIAAARRIEAGKLDERLRLTRRDEIGALAEAFDTMLDRLAMALTAQKRFVADAAHELKTPLTALGGSVEMLQLGADRGDPATIRRLLDGMEREIARLSRLVAGLLALSRLDADQPIERAPVSLAVLLEEVADETRVMAQGQRVACRIDATPTVLGDADRLKQALLNLSANALAYTPEAGSIELALTQRNGAAEITVADTGAGIDPALLPRVMERFVRGDASRSRATGGSGLGLAIVRGIVEAHGGTIALESAPGAGTRVTISLPVAARRSNGARPRTPAPVG